MFLKQFISPAVLSFLLLCISSSVFAQSKHANVLHTLFIIIFKKIFKNTFLVCLCITYSAHVLSTSLIFIMKFITAVVEFDSGDYTVSAEDMDSEFTLILSEPVDGELTVVIERTSQAGDTAIGKLYLFLKNVFHFLINY